LLEVGFVGLAVFGGMLASFLYALYRNHIGERRPENFMAVTLLVMFMTLGITGHPFGFTTQYWYLLILLSLLNVPSNAAARDYAEGTPSVRARDSRVALVSN
jgi:O-antigen ligase